MYGEYLAHLGWPVTLTSDVEHALGRVHAGEIEVLLVDAQMAGRAGFAVVSAFKAHPRSRYLPAVIVAAYAPTGTAARACGADVVILKPCLPQVLASVIEDVAPKFVDLSLTGRAKASDAVTEYR